MHPRSRLLPLRTVPSLALAALALLAALTLLANGCGSGDSDGDGAGAASGSPRYTRDPRLIEAQEAVERGMVDVARTLLGQIRENAGVDHAVLEAKILHLEGQDLDVIRVINQAKTRWPDDARVWAAEAEHLASLGRVTGAEEAIREGWRRAGKAPELERAQGILLLSTPGGAEYGLAHLEKGLELDPGLPYTGLPLAAAHILAGRMDIAREAFEDAHEHALAALAWDPSGPDSRELAAEALTGLLRYEEALALYEELEADGRPRGATRSLLHCQAATTSLLLKDRAKAVEHYLAARALGTSDDELGFGMTVLAQESEAAIERGITAYAEARLDDARRELERALELDPRATEAWNHLGVVLFRLADYQQAAEAWSVVLAAASRLEDPLPEPVHLNLAKAWRLAGELDKARAVLSNYLDREPEGSWAEETRDLLFRLEEAALAEKSSENGD